MTKPDGMEEPMGPLAEVDPGQAGSGSEASGEVRGGGSASGASDRDYDLISVLYHATHGAWNYDAYIADATEAGDEDLASFFRDVRDENARRAARAKQLLSERISG